MSDMYENELPEFAKRKMFQVLPYTNKIFVAQHDGRNHLVRVIPYADGHFRAVFSARYFELPEGATQPSKSQWNTLKKKFKRHSRQAFVFKEVGQIDCQTKSPEPLGNETVPTEESQCLYIDFGFYLD